MLRLNFAEAVSTQGGRAPLQVSYDAATHSYTVSADGRSQLFGPAGRENGFGEVRYTTPNEVGAADYLTLVTTPYSHDTANRYVAMGYWQHNKVDGDQQATKFYTFAYGFETATAALPRTGFGSWRTDIFGLLTLPGARARTMQGEGRFDVDLAQGAFSTSGMIREDEVAGGGGSTSIGLAGGGNLSSDGRFSGFIAYTGSVGPIEGSFYGPGADELGASFVATDSNGGVLNGALTGQRDGMVPEHNLTLLNIFKSELLAGTHNGINMQTRDGEALGTLYPADGGAVGGVTVTPDGPTTISLQYGDYAQIGGLARDAVQPRTNFTRYTGHTLAGTPVQVDFYRPGSGNSELALTYTSFVTWHQHTPQTLFGGQQAINDATHYLLYGIQPAQGLIRGLTGTGSYSGVVYAHGASTGGAHYDIGGSSSFAVDFSAARYSGSLRLNGTDAAGAARDFGQHDFTGALNGSGFDFAWLAPPSDQGQVIRPTFYGPQAQEIGATFNLRTGEYQDPATVHIEGIAVAKRQ